MKCNRELLAFGVFGRASRLGERIAGLLERGREFSPRVSGWALLGCMIVGAITAVMTPRMVAFAQAKPAFEVASVKPDETDAHGFGIGTDPGKLTMNTVTLKDAIEWAYGVKDYQVAGPALLDTGRYNIVAKAGSPVPEGQLKQMLQTLLADRFKLALHRQTKDLPVLVLAAGKGSNKLRQAKVDGPSGMIGEGIGHVRGQKASMAALADYLTAWMGRAVLDRTGLTGIYDFELAWAPAEGEPGWRGADPSRPSIFTAVEEQLGLRLESRKGPVEVLVIDHVEKPDAN